MKSDRFKKPATLSRYARQMGKEAVEMTGAGPILVDYTHGSESYDFKSLTRGSTDDQGWHALFSQILAELNESPLASALIRRAIKKGWAIGLSDSDARQGDYFYCLDIDSKTIWLDHGGFSADAIRRTAHCREALTGSIVRALRDIGHETRLGAYEIALRPDAVLMMERARNADIETICVLVAWEMRSAGHAGLWRHLLSSEDGDIALTFGYTLEKSPRSLYDGKALSETFLRWYADKTRINACDHMTLEMLDDLMAHKDTDESWGKLSFTVEDARDLSILPDGLAYLKEEAKAIVHDPEYQTVPDAINEAHLFHIAHDVRVVQVGGVPFRTASLARLIFPTAP